MSGKKCGNLSISPWIGRFSHLIFDGGTVLDLAAGAGRHSRWFLDQGFRVTALDRQVEPLEGLRKADPGSSERLEIIRADLEDGSPWPLGGRRFDAVVVVNYLWRPLLPRLFGILAPGGVLLYETFAAGQGAFGKPTNPDFLLESGELLAFVQGRLQVVAYEHGRIDGPAGPAVKQRIAATGRTMPVALTYS